MGVDSLEALLPRASSSCWCENGIICNLEFEGRTRLDVDGVQLKHSKLQVDTSVFKMQVE